MQGVANEAEFANPRRLERWQLRAGGWHDKRSAHEGGVWNPLPVKLRRGTVLYRVGHSHSKRGVTPEAITLSSPWWMDGETMQSISNSAHTLGASHQSIARLKLSVSARYGVFDTIVCVRLCEALGALRGAGNPVFDPPEGDSTAPAHIWAMPGTAVMQCFIPGLRDFHERPTGLAERAFHVLGTAPVHSWQKIDATNFMSVAHPA